MVVHFRLVFLKWLLPKFYPLCLTNVILLWNDFLFWSFCTLIFHRRSLDTALFMFVSSTNDLTKEIQTKTLYAVRDDQIIEEIVGNVLVYYNTCCNIPSKWKLCRCIGCKYTLYFYIYISLHKCLSHSLELRSQTDSRTKANQVNDTSFVPRS